MEIYIKYASGRAEWIGCTTFKVQDNMLVLEIDPNSKHMSDGHVLGTTYFIPLYTVEKFIPSASEKRSTYVQ